MANNSKKRRFSLLSRLFGNRNKERSFLEEEQLQSPAGSFCATFCTTSWA